MSMKKKIKIGTRGSKLALYQARRTQAELKKYFPELEVELEIIHTKGDKVLDVALSKIGDKGLFTKEIEQALLDGRIDLAVHSMKDLPTVFPEKLKLGAVLERGEARDALVSTNGRKLSELTEEDVIATSSVRRRAQLLKYNPNFNIIDIRGNVDTRLKKWRNGYCTAMIMAAAGLQRLELDDTISEIVDVEQIIPAPAQGIIAIENREGDDFVDRLLQKINHHNSWIKGRAEYAFLEALEGGCQVPIGCISEVNGNEFSIRGVVLSPNGQKSILDNLQSTADKAVETAKKLAASFLEKGALQIIGAIERF